MKIQIEQNVRLYVDIEGAGLVPDGPLMRDKPTLVLLHGGPGYDHTAFKPAFSQLADIAQIVYYDHRGHGRSDACPPREWTLDTFADDVVRLCDALGISQPIVLGQSFGGFVAQRYLARHPGHPAKVILSSTSASLGLGRKLAMFEKLGGPAARAAAQRFWSEPCAATYAPYLQLCKPLYSVRPAANGDAARRAIVSRDILYAWAAGEQQTMDLLPGLAHALCPVLVLAGESDPVCTLDDARDIAAALPQHLVQFERFDGCGHGVWRDAPVAAFARLRQFITA
ncbi:alpha/beta hydrolase [Janthinobacterium sp.]|uniref:alpha/beta fold hydrolase n=1 Tax=Janthinobacterium sp. TaxID=1871054 RepID=UPI00293D8A56|nr:alpha/beta hydrolase [Janthinobacterium sp.]